MRVLRCYAWSSPVARCDGGCKRKMGRRCHTSLSPSSTRKSPTTTTTPKRREPPPRPRQADHVRLFTSPPCPSAARPGSVSGEQPDAPGRALGRIRPDRRSPSPAHPYFLPWTQCARYPDPLCALVSAVIAQEKIREDENQGRVWRPRRRRVVPQGLVLGDKGRRCRFRRKKGQCGSAVRSLLRRLARRAWSPTRP